MRHQKAWRASALQEGLVCAVLSLAGQVMSYFPTTHWSVVLTAGQGSTQNSRLALEQLCATYWYPLYAFVRSQGALPHDAEDLTQAFFAHLLEKRLISKAQPDQGKFRSFLLGCFKNFRLTHSGKLQTQKRGGNCTVVSFGEMEAEERYAYEPVDRLTPEIIFDRDWAIVVLDEAHKALQQEYARAGQKSLFATLNRFLQSRDGPAYVEVAAQLGKTEAAIKMEIFRMRRRYGEWLRQIVTQTVSDPSEVEPELRHLLDVLTL